MNAIINQVSNQSIKMSKLKIKVILVVKYFTPMKRPSGILNFVLNLSDSLGKMVDLTIITWRYEKKVPRMEEKLNYKIIRTGKPFLLSSAWISRKLQPDIIIFGTGIYKVIILIPYLLIFKILTYKIPVILGQYGTMENKHAYLGNLLKPLIEKVIATNQEIYDFYMKTLGEKVVYIPPGVDIQKLNKIHSIQNNFERPIIGFFGHLNYDKGSDILFEAFQELENTKGSLVMAGEGSLLENFQKNKNTNIHIFEYLPDVKSYIKACDLLVFPFRNQVTILGLSLSAIEGMAMAKPLLVTKNPCLSVLVKNGENGYIFNNKEELEKYLKEILSSEYLLTTMGKKSFKLAQNYDIKNIASQYLKQIKEICVKK